jgi:hypothetical protein
VLALGRLPVNNRGIPYRMTRFKTTVRLVDDAGLAFVLPDEVFGSPTRVSRLPAKPSIRVEGLKVDRPFRVEAGPRARGPRIKVADPTTLVKLFAVAAEGAWLTWAVDQRHGLALRIRIWLVLPQERPARTAQGLVAQEWDDEVCPWLSLGLPDIAVPAEDALAIQEWFPWTAPDVARHFWDLPLTRPGEGSRSRPKEATA